MVQFQEYYLIFTLKSFALLTGMGHLKLKLLSKSIVDCHQSPAGIEDELVMSVFKLYACAVFV
jgi:hypothetical protein